MALRATNDPAQPPEWHRHSRGTDLSQGDLARLEGFEPPTNGFGSHYSIRLSYRRVAGDSPMDGAAARALTGLVGWRDARAAPGPAPGRSARDGPAVAPAPGAVLDPGARRPADRLAAAAVADVVGPMDRRRRRAAAVDPVRVQRRGVADALGRLRDQRLRRPLAGRFGRAHEGAAAGDRRGVRARGAGGVRGADAGRVRAGAHAQPADGADEHRRGAAGGHLSLPQALHLPAAGVPGHG